MSFIQVGNEQIRLNGEGHLASYDDWTEDVARAMAERDQIVLEKCHWIAIHFMREFYQEYETEIPAKEVGEIVMANLSQLDEVAYIRFASVYQEFHSADDFINEVSRLTKRPIRS